LHAAHHHARIAAEKRAATSRCCQLCRNNWDPDGEKGGRMAYVPFEPLAYRYLKLSCSYPCNLQRSTRCSIGGQNKLILANSEQSVVEVASWEYQRFVASSVASRKLVDVQIHQPSLVLRCRSYRILFRHCGNEDQALSMTSRNARLPCGWLRGRT